MTEAEPVVRRNRRRSPVSRMPPLPEKLLAYSAVDPVTGCRNWQRSTKPKGYGQVCVADGVRVPAHRAAYELAKGPIPPGYHIDHLCRNPGCINPDHLEAVTSRINTLRGVSPAAANAVKTHCVNGHLFDPGNTLLIHRKGRPWRECRACHLIRAAAYRAKKRQQRLSANEGRIDRGGDKRTESCRQRGRRVSFRGQTMCVSEWARRIGISPSGITFRLDAGWPLERALTEGRRRDLPHAK